MIELKKIYSQKGQTLTQLYKDGELAIYEKMIQGETRPTYSWEIFKIRIGTPNRFRDDEYEKYPEDEAFGGWAWSCCNEKHLNAVLKREFPDHKLAKDGFQLQ